MLGYSFQHCRFRLPVIGPDCPLESMPHYAHVFSLHIYLVYIAEVQA